MWANKCGACGISIVAKSMFWVSIGMVVHDYKTHGMLFTDAWNPIKIVKRVINTRRRKYESS